MLAVGEPQQQVPRFTDPDYDHFYTKPQKRRGIGDLIKFSSRQNSPWIFQEPTSSQLIRASEPRGAQPNVLANALCPRKVDGESYWSVTADEEFLQRLKTQVDNLLYAQDHKLHRRDRRTLSVYFELFMVGKTAETARMAVVITCLQSEDQDRVRKLIRKYPHVPEYDNVELKVMLGSPRSSKPLIKLASGESDDDDGDGWGTFSRTRQRRQVPSNEVTVGTSVYGVTDHHGSLLIPATIFIGEKKDGQHKATLGGLVSLVRSRQKLGFTIAHTSSDQDKTEKTTEASEESNRTCIGTISRKSREDSADWALIKFHVGIHPRTSLLPPETISIIGDESTAIRVLSTRGSLKGTLSGSVTWINIDGSPSSTKAWPISLDNSIRRGDCGSWVVGPKNELLGYIVYGHEEQTLAYILSAEDAFNQIDDVHAIRLSDISPKERRRVSRSERHAHFSVLPEKDKPLDAETQRIIQSTSGPVHSDNEVEIIEVRRDEGGNMRVIKDNEREKTKHRRPRRIYSSSSSNTSSSDDSNIEYVRKRRRSHTSKRLIYTWSGNLKSMAVCMAYLIFFALVAVQYYIVAAWALSSNSKLATQSRATLARLMAQSIDALLLHVAEEPAKAGVTELENVKDNKIFDRKTTDDDPRKSIEDRRTMPVPKPALALNSALNRTSAVRAAYYPSLFGTYAYSDDGGNSSTDSSSSVVHRPSGVYSRGNRTLVGPVKSNQRDESPWYRHRPRPTTGIVYSDEDIANDYVFPQRQITFYPDTERAERRGLEYREPLSTYRSRSYRPREERDSNLKGHERSRETPLVRRKSSLERDNSLLKGHKPSSETPLVRRKSSFERTRPNPVIDPDYQDNLYEPRRQRSGIDRGFTRDAPIVINRIGGVETGVRRRPDSWLDDEVYWPGRAETPIRYRTILNTDTRRGQSSAHDAGLEEELRHKIEREIDLGVERGMEDELSRIKRQNRQRSTLPEERVVAFWPGHRDERPVVTTRPRDSGVTRERPEYYETRDFSDTYEFEGRPRPRPHYIPDDELRIQQLRAREAQIRDEIRDLELQEQRKFEKKRMEDEMFAKAKSEAEGRLREYENKELDNVRWERSRHERKERSYREPKLRGESGGWNFDIPEPPSSPSDTSDTSRSSEVLTAHERRMRQKGKELNQLSSPKPKDSASRTGKVWRNHGWKQEPTDGITITPITTYEERYQGALVKYEGSPNEVEEESINGGIIRRVTAEETSDEEFEPDAPARTRALDPDGDEIIKELSADEIGDLYD